MQQHIQRGLVDEVAPDHLRRPLARAHLEVHVARGAAHPDVCGGLAPQGQGGVGAPALEAAEGLQALHDVVRVLLDVAGRHGGGVLRRKRGRRLREQAPRLRLLQPRHIVRAVRIQEGVCPQKAGILGLDNGEHFVEVDTPLLRILDRTAQDVVGAHPHGLAALRGLLDIDINVHDDGDQHRQHDENNEEHEAKEEKEGVASANRLHGMEVETAQHHEE
mmetsp:Transcript_4418/g.9954  ORF Transcript_4418/g.9954 Transcript_4418/m.9954 type:complete len:219 (-) Transcript_4418:15-671(-)